MQPFLDALERRTPTGSAFRSREWAAVAPAIRQRAFFSATITSARVLTRWRSLLLDYLAAETEEVVTPDGRTEIAYKEVGLARFRDRAADMLISEGLAKPSDFKDARLSNPVSNARLQLVFNTNTEQAQTFAAWQRRVTNPDYLNQFPAARFVRSPGARIKRERHVQAEGEVRRWDDFAFWQYQNAADIGGFGVPWGPFGFNSYMRQEPIKRKEAEKLKLVRPGERLTPPDLTQFGVTPAKQFNAGVEATIDDIPEEIRQKAVRTITERLGPQVLTPDGKLTLEAIRRARGLPPGGPGPKPAKKVPSVTSVPSMPTVPQLPAAQPRRTYRAVVQALDPLRSQADAMRREYEELINEQAAARRRMEALGVVDKTTREYAEAQDSAARLSLAMADSIKKHKALIEQAREAISIPVDQRGKLVPTFASNVTPALKKSPTLTEGMRIVERYTAKSLLPRFSVKATKKSRAFASGSQINIRASTSASVVAHEITHVTESTSPLYQKANAFLLKRANGQQPQQLKKLTNVNYDKDEIAYEDDWKKLGGNAYSGKLYRSLRSTEILTMGIERLHADPLKFLRTDPDYFEFVVKTLQDLP